MHCLNNEDCLGANRLCFRNASMTEGVCTCKTGFKPAEGNIIKCLNTRQYSFNTYLKQKTEAETLFKKVINNTAQKDRRLKRRNVFCILGNGFSCKIYQILQYKSSNM